MDFGCVLADTFCRTSVKLTNPGKAGVQYAWAWLRQDTPPAPGGLDAAEPSSSTLGALVHAGSVRGPGSVGLGSGSCAPPPRALFDILPIRGVLGPRESEEVEVSFYSHPGAKALAAAVCHVVDGPDLQVGEGW